MTRLILGLTRTCESGKAATQPMKTFRTTLGSVISTELRRPRLSFDQATA